MSTSASYTVHSKLGVSCAAIALAIGCALGSASSAQVGAGNSSTPPLQAGANTVQAKPLIVLVDHKTIETVTTASTVELALNDAHVQLGKNDIVRPNLNGALPKDGIVHVQRVVSWTQNICSRIAPASVTEVSDTMVKNTTRVKQIGSAGLLQTTIRFYDDRR